MAALASLKEELKPFKNALSDLNLMAKQGFNLMDKGVKALDKQKAKDTKTGVAKTVGVKAIPLFEVGTELASQVPCSPLKDAVPMDELKVPTIFTACDDSCLGDIKELWKSVEHFGGKWRDSSMRESKGRAERAVKGEALVSAKSVMSKVVLESGCVPMDKVGQDLHPACFGVASGLLTVSCERARCPTMRIGKGTRTMILTSGASMRKFMEKKGLTGITPETMNSFLRQMNKDTITAYIDGGASLYSCTVGPTDLLLLPFDTMFAESVATTDLLGMRFSFWLKKDIEVMEEVAKWLVGCKRGSGALQSAIDVILST